MKYLKSLHKYTNILNEQIVINKDLVNDFRDEEFESEFKKLKEMELDAGMGKKHFVISDTHFYHKSAIDKIGRPFVDVDEMNQAMIDNWNSVVRDGDTVFHLGDFSLKTGLSTLEELFKQLNGYTILILGNYDSQRKMSKMFDRVPNLKSVHKALRLKFGGMEYILTHYPMRDWPGKDNGAIHLHGHTHHPKMRSGDSSYNLSVEAIGYKPIELGSIAGS